MTRTMLTLAGAAIAAALLAPAVAAERSPYDSNPDCMRRDAKASDCTVDTGPPQRRGAPPPPQNPTAPQPAPQPSNVKR